MRAVLEYMLFDMTLWEYVACYLVGLPVLKFVMFEGASNDE